MNFGHTPTGSRPIGYYVHHHGAGHAARFTNISRQYARQFAGEDAGRDADEGDGGDSDAGESKDDRPLIALSESAVAGGVLLPTDVPAVAIDPTAGGALHWAPLAPDVSSVRMKTVLDWIVRERPVGMVVDVSVEMALLCRLAGVPTMIVRQHGSRVDLAHELAFRTATCLLAPFPAALEHCSTPGWVVRKTVYCGFISPPAALGADVGTEPAPGRDDVVVLWGRGGGTLSTTAISALAAAVPTSTVVWLAGELAYDGAASNVESLGFVRRADRLLRNAPVVVASAGNNVVSEAASRGCALIVVPQDRPFEEQLRHAEALDSAGAAAGVGDQTSTDSWKSAIRTAQERRPVLSALGVGDGARVAAAEIRAAFD